MPVPRSDLATAADALIGNIFKHTGEGTGFAVTLHRGEGLVLVFVADAGPGSATRTRPCAAAAAAAGSTGLGLDIARRVAESTGGGLKIDTLRARRRAGPAAAATGAPRTPPGRARPGQAAYQSLRRHLSAA